MGIKLRRAWCWLFHSFSWKVAGVFGNYYRCPKCEVGSDYMPLESVIVNKMLDYLNKEVKGCIAEKVHGNKYQVGRSDINGCWKGRSFRIEGKSPDHGNKPSKAQILDMKMWSKAGALCFATNNLEDVKRIINNTNNPLTIGVILDKSGWLIEVTSSESLCSHGQPWEDCPVCRH